MRSATSVLLFAVAMMCCGGAQAAETVTYSYDAQGRLIKVVHSGTVNNGVTTDYTLDDSDNRTNVTKTGVP